VRETILLGCQGEHATFGECMFDNESAFKWVGQGTAARENRGRSREAGEDSAGSGSSKREGIGKEIRNANFCHSLRVQMLSKTSQNSKFYLTYI